MSPRAWFLAAQSSQRGWYSHERGRDLHVGGDGGPEPKTKKRKRGSAGGHSTNAINSIGAGERKRLAREKADPGGTAR